MTFLMQTVDVRNAGEPPYCRIVLTKEGDDRTAKWQVSNDGQYWNDYASNVMILAGRKYVLQSDGSMLAWI